MTYIYYLISYITGLATFSFFIIQSLIIILFAIPSTKKLSKYNYLTTNNNIIRTYFLSLLLFIPIFTIITYLLYKNINSNYFTFYIVGCLFSLFFGFSQLGVNKNNISDFIDSNKEKIKVHPGEVIELLLRLK